MNDKYRFHSAHGRLAYDLHDKNWVTHIGINTPSNCKADAKNKGYQEKMLFDWKIQLEKVQLTRDLKDDTIFYQIVPLSCKIDRSFCVPTIRSQATIVWFPEDTCTRFQVARIHARRIKVHQKSFSESIPHDKINLDKIRQNRKCYNNIDGIEKKLKCFQI